MRFQFTPQPAENKGIHLVMIPNRFVGGNRGPLELREGSKTRIDINIRPWICEKYYTIRKDGFRDEEA
jgi:hypothetical protein